MIFTLRRILLELSNQGKEMGVEFSRISGYLRDLDISGEIILKRILKIYIGRMLTGFMRLNYRRNLWT